MQLITILLITHMFENIDSFAFSSSEEMDYSVPFDFLSSTEDKFLANKQLDVYKDNSFNSYDTKVINEATIPHTYDQDLINKGNLDNHYKLELNESTDNLSEDLKIDEELKNDILKMNDKTAKKNGKIAVINFDDNWVSQYQNTKPILDNYQFKATFYIVCDYIGGKNRMTWQQIKSLQQDGHEIGSHTMNHENLDQIPIDARYGEIVESKNCIEDNGIRVNSFSYPFNSGDSNQEILKLVADNYDFARTAGGNSNAENVGKHEDYERFTIIGWSHDTERKKHNYSDLQMHDAFKDYISEFDKEDTSGTGNIPIIIYHNIDDEKGTYNTSLDLFNSEMQYLYENGFKAVTMNEVFGHNSYE